VGLSPTVQAHDASSYVPNVTALMASTAAIYELLGNAARVTFAALHLRRQSP
jgi:hypothetical protein